MDQSPFGYQEGIRSVTTTSLDGDVIFPVLFLQQTTPLWFQFDWLTDDQEWLNYRIFHCNAEGIINDLDYTEYVQNPRTQAIHPKVVKSCQKKFYDINTIINRVRREVGL
jgi:hypothetical protein